MNFFQKVFNFILLLFYSQQLFSYNDYKWNRLYRASKCERSQRYWELKGQETRKPLKPSGTTEPILSVRQQQERGLLKQKTVSKKNISNKSISKESFVIEELKNAISKFKSQKIQEPLKLSFENILSNNKVAQILLFLPQDNIYGEFKTLKVVRNFSLDDITDKSKKDLLAPLMSDLNIPSTFALLSILKIYESSDESFPAEISYLLAKMNVSGFKDSVKYFDDVVQPIKDLINMMMIIKFQDDGLRSEITVSDFLIDMNKTFKENLDVDFYTIPKNHEEIDLADLAIGIGSIIFKVITDLPKLEEAFESNDKESFYQKLIDADEELEKTKILYQDKLKEYEKKALRQAQDDRELKGRIGAHPASTGMLARPYTKSFRAQEAFFKSFSGMYDNYKLPPNQLSVNEFLEKSLFWFKAQTTPKNFKLAIEWLKPLKNIGISLDFLSENEEESSVENVSIQTPSKKKNVIAEKWDAFTSGLKRFFS